MTAPDRSISKRCTCKTPAGKQLGASCPKLRRADGNWSPHHGAWRYQYELPPTTDGTRRQLRRHGFDTRDAAAAERDTARELIALAGDDPDLRRDIGDLLHALKPGEPLPERHELARRVHAGVAVHSQITVADYLNEWFTHRHDRLSPNTRLSYSGHIDKHFKPHFGHVPLQKLRTIHLQALFTAIEQRNAEILAARASTDENVRATVRGVRPMGDASQHRVLATIRKALNDAIKAHRLIEYNPAIHVELGSGAPPKPKLWTKAAIARWRRTGERPSPVMVWTPELFGEFLDAAEQHGPELVEMFEIIGHRGLRRGEACGLRPNDVDLEHGLLTVEEQITSVGYEPIVKQVKSRAGIRTVPLGDDNVATCRRYQARRAAWKLAAGDKWISSGRYFVRPDGSAWHPERVSQVFDNIVIIAGLPPVRLHDLRHIAATLMIATGANLKEVQETLGHSKYQVTADTYTSILEELQKTTANKVSKLVPRGRRTPRPEAA